MKALWCGIVWLASLCALWWLVAALLATLRYVETSIVWDGEYDV